jgi:FG-GAP-like repeat
MTVAASLLSAGTALAGIQFYAGDPVGVAPTPQYLLAGDLTNDGLTDVIVVSPASAAVDVLVASPDTPSRFAEPRRLHFGDDLLAPALGDLDVDGRLDLVVADGRAHVVWIALGKGDGTFADPYEIAVPGALRPTAVAIGNFHDSGHPDLAVADQRLGRVFILRNDGGTPPCFAAGGAVAVGAEPTRISSADLNGDGRPDLTTLNVDRPRGRVVSIALWKRIADGDPEFDAAGTYPVGAQPSEMLLADFDDDGGPDIATIDHPMQDPVGRILILMNDGAGVFSATAPVDVRCPFFTYGAPCRLLALTGGDISGDGVVDLVVALSDPRPSGGTAVSAYDAMQVLAGRGDGRFVPGPVFTLPKSPVSMVADTLAASGRIDVGVIAQRPPTLQAFVNVSGPGLLPNGDECLVGDECLSSHCVNGVCCATQCGAGEQCNIPGRRGRCHPVLPDLTECTGQLECDPAESCVDGFCCDDPCEGGRCDRDGFLGLCIPGIADGQPCSGDDRDCASGICGDNFVCCREVCEAGYCDRQGVCHLPVPQGEPCLEDAECLSNVCDVFDGICCNRRCDLSEGCPFGTCGRVPEEPVPFPGNSSTGASALSSAANPCASCPSGTQRTDGLCTASNGDDDGCSTVGGRASRTGLFMVTLLPLGFWIARRGQLSRARRRRSQLAG